MRFLCVLLLFASACDDDTTAADLGPADLSAVSDGSIVDLSVAPDGGGGPTAARGQYLVEHLLFCGGCHTTPDSSGNPDPTKFLAGGRSFSVPNPEGGVGTVYAANLTPEPTTGIGSWSASNIVDALTVGVDKDGNPLSPIMPYSVFGLMTQDDAMSIAMYLQTVPPIVNAVPQNTVPPPPMAAPRVDETKIPHTTLASSDPAFAGAERGRYLAKLGCLSCHTPSPNHQLDLTQAFAGGVEFVEPSETTISANLTPDATGLASFTVADIVATLKTDLERGTGRMLCPPMPGGAMRLGGLTDGDLGDLATFVHTLAPIAHGPFGCSDAGVAYGLDGGI